MRNYAKPVLVAGPSRRLCLQFLCPRSSCDWLFPSFSSQLKCPLLSEGFLKASHHPAPLHPTTQFAQLHCPIVLSTSETILFSDDSICPVLSTADSPLPGAVPGTEMEFSNCVYMGARDNKHQPVNLEAEGKRKASPLRLLVSSPIHRLLDLLLPQLNEFRGLHSSWH